MCRFCLQPCSFLPTQVVLKAEIQRQKAHGNLNKVASVCEKGLMRKVGAGVQMGGAVRWQRRVSPRTSGWMDGKWQWRDNGNVTEERDREAEWPTIYTYAHIVTPLEITFKQLQGTFHFVLKEFVLEASERDRCNLFLMLYLFFKQLFAGQIQMTECNFMVM